MKISILGIGCPKCKKLAELTEKAVKEAGVEAEIIKVTDMKEIVGYGVLFTPALVINGKIKASGKLPTIDEIKSWIK